ncbi:MAG TPA: imidazole glycerol phosphate synthase cyclase subunit [Vicinamibacterales bacterium]|nr:imidazole glycerol phosphate synthase cyclase subunit [Vicinamibacterales bacterium]
MLKKRIIPKLLLRNGRNVKGVKFTELRDTGSPVTNARIYDAQGADELIFLDIEASGANRKILYDTITKTASEVFMPFCVGGGIRTVDDVRQLLLAGADKISVNTQAVERPDLVSEGAALFGVQCMVVSIDFKRHGPACKVYTHGGTVATELDVLDHAQQSVARGAGEILLTSIDRDGTMQGYDLEITKRVADAVDVPVIASGGAGTLQHLCDVIADAHASAVAVGSLFHFTDQSPIKARAFMHVRGIDVRSERTGTTAI